MKCVLKWVLQTHHNEDSLSASFESMSIGTQYSDSSNDGNIFPPNTMSNGQPSSNPSASIDEEYGMINYPHTEQINVIPHSISNATRISNVHVGEPRISYP